MGREICRGILAAPDLLLAGAVDPAAVDRPLSDLVGGKVKSDFPVAADAEQALRQWSADVWIDFTVASAARVSIPLVIARGVAPVVGTTGLTVEEVDGWQDECQRRGLGAAFIPNFSVGAMLLEQFMRRCVRLIDKVEIVELHHAGKRDAPSGTALRLKRALQQEMAGPSPEGSAAVEVPVHSVRLPGFVAHHEAIFGAEGETLTLRHDVIDRRAFIPPLLLTVRRVARDRLLARGLEDVYGTP